MSHIFNRGSKSRERKSGATTAAELPAEFVELDTFDGPSSSTAASSTADRAQSTRDRLAGILQAERDLQAERESLYASSPHLKKDKAAAKTRNREKTDPTKVLIVVLLLGLLVWILPTTWLFGSNTGRCCRHCADHHHIEVSARPQVEMPWQKEFTLPSRGKGCYLVTKEVTNEISEGLKDTKIGILTLFIKHTSASLSLNENYDPTVRSDMTMAMDHIVPEQGGIKWEHTDEGLDDSASHTKASLFGSSVTIPITNGRLNLGTWQGIYCCEFRSDKHTRKIVATILP